MRFTPIGFLLLAAAPIAVAAQGADGSDAGTACVTAAMDWYVAHTNAAVIAASKAGGAPANTVDLLAARTERQKACLLGIDPRAASGPGLTSLARAYSASGLDSLALIAAARRLTELRSAPGNVRAAAMNVVISVLAKPDVASLAKAERYVATLDALGSSVRNQSIAGHGAMTSAYVQLDSVAEIRVHSQRIVALARGVSLLSPSPRWSITTHLVVEAYTDLAQVYDEVGRKDSALVELARIASDHPELRGARLDSILAPVRAHLGLVGIVATPIVASHWLNADSGTRSFSPAGKVSLIEFSATWCGPCKATYPVLTALAGQFPGTDVQLVLATELYGRGAGPGRLSVSEEVAADEAFFVDKYNLRFPIAIADRRPGGTAADTTSNSSNAGHYAVTGIPEIVVVDRHGIIRRVMEGWDKGNARRLELLLTQLMSERR